MLNYAKTGSCFRFIPSYFGCCKFTYLEAKCSDWGNTTIYVLSYLEKSIFLLKVVSFGVYIPGI
jgi:hypothetical protein